MAKKYYLKPEYSILLLVLIGIFMLITPFSFENTRQASFIAKWNEKYNRVEYMFSVINAHITDDVLKSFNKAKDAQEREAILLAVVKPYLRINTDKYPPKHYKLRYMNGTRVYKGQLYKFDDFYFAENNTIVGIKDIKTDKSEEIKRALEEPTEDDLPSPKYVASEVTEPRDIKIDINDPEKLPVPKSLNSHIISDEEVLTSQEAFDKLAVHINKEVMLEIPSLNNLSDRFLSHVPSSYSRIIIDEFDPSDMSYMFLISSLLKQGVHIKTVPKVHTVNLIADDSYAMIISAGNNDFEYGAIYDDRDSISTIRSSFEKTWSIASNLDESILVQYAGGSA